MLKALYGVCLILQKHGTSEKDSRFDSILSLPPSLKLSDGDRKYVYLRKKCFEQVD